MRRWARQSSSLNLESSVGLETGDSTALRRESGGCVREPRRDDVRHWRLDRTLMRGSHARLLYVISRRLGSRYNARRSSLRLGRGMDHPKGA